VIQVVAEPTSRRALSSRNETFDHHPQHSFHAAMCIALWLVQRHPGRRRTTRTMGADCTALCARRPCPPGRLAPSARRRLSSSLRRRAAQAAYPRMHGAHRRQFQHPPCAVAAARAPGLQGPPSALAARYHYPASSRRSRRHRTCRQGYVAASFWAASATCSRYSHQTRKEFCSKRLLQADCQHNAMLITCGPI